MYLPLDLIWAAYMTWLTAL